MNSTLVKVLQIIAILFVGMIALNMLTAIVVGVLKLVVNVAILAGVCFLIYYVVKGVRQSV